MGSRRRIMLQSPFIRDYSIYGNSVADGDSIKGVGDTYAPFADSEGRQIQTTLPDGTRLKWRQLIPNGEISAQAVGFGGYALSNRKYLEDGTICGTTNDSTDSNRGFSTTTASAERYAEHRYAYIAEAHTTELSCRFSVRISQWLWSRWNRSPIVTKDTDFLCGVYDEISGTGNSGIIYFRFYLSNYGVYETLYLNRTCLLDLTQIFAECPQYLEQIVESNPESLNSVLWSTDDHRLFFTAYTAEPVDVVCYGGKLWKAAEEGTCHMPIKVTDANGTETTYACPIPSPLQGVGGVADSADYEAQGITRRFGVATLNFCFAASNSYLDDKTPCLIVQFRQLSSVIKSGNWQKGACAEYEVGNGIKTANCFRFGANNTWCYLYYIGEDFNDLDSANAYLAEHPIHIAYPLAAQTFEPCVLPSLAAHKRNAVVTTDTQVQPSKVELEKAKPWWVGKLNKINDEIQDIVVGDKILRKVGLYKIKDLSVTTGVVSGVRYFLCKGLDYDYIQNTPARIDNFGYYGTINATAAVSMAAYTYEHFSLYYNTGSQNSRIMFFKTKAISTIEEFFNLVGDSNGYVKLPKQYYEDKDGNKEYID